jgi:hypothetical protein
MIRDSTPPPHKPEARRRRIIAPSEQAATVDTNCEL